MTGGAGAGKNPSLSIGDHKEIRQTTRSGSQDGKNWQSTGKDGPPDLALKLIKAYSSTRPGRNTTAGGVPQLTATSVPKTDRLQGG